MGSVNEKPKPLILGSVLEQEMQELIETELPNSDPHTTRYLARLFSAVQNQTWEDIRLMRSGVRQETLSRNDRPHVFEEKLDLSRRVGDGCLALCAFYTGDAKPAGIKLNQLPVREPSPEPVPSVDKRRFANEYEPTPLRKPMRFKSKPIEPGLEVADLGRTSYAMASLYSGMLQQHESWVYQRLAENFLPVIIWVAPAILRNYMGNMNPPKRVIVYTPHGEMLFRLKS